MKTEIASFYAWNRGIRCGFRITETSKKGVVRQYESEPKYTDDTHARIGAAKFLELKHADGNPIRGFRFTPKKDGKYSRRARRVAALFDEKLA